MSNERPSTDYAIGSGCTIVRATLELTAGLVSFEIV
jgi:hypothetical protein